MLFRMYQRLEGMKLLRRNEFMASSRNLTNLKIEFDFIRGSKGSKSVEDRMSTGWDSKTTIRLDSKEPKFIEGSYNQSCMRVILSQYCHNLTMLEEAHFSLDKRNTAFMGSVFTMGMVIVKLFS